MEPLIGWLLKAFASPVTMLAFIREAVGFIRDFEKGTKGADKETKKQARENALKSARQTCEGVGCPTGLK